MDLVTDKVVLEEVKTLSVKIPAGVDTGDRIRLSGKGEAGPQGGPAGDLFVQMNVRPHDIFVRDGSNLHCEVPISFAKAALGGELEVPTLSGKVKLKNSIQRLKAVSYFDYEVKVYRLFEEVLKEIFCVRSLLKRP